MDAQTYQGASYDAPRGEEQQQRQEQRMQQRAQRASMSNIPEDPSNHYASITQRKRADSHQPNPLSPRSRRSVDAEQIHPSAISAHLRSSYDYDDRPRRLSSADYASPYGEVRRLSGNFNAPTHVELEREKEHRKALTSVEKLRSKVKRLVRA